MIVKILLKLFEKYIWEKKTVDECTNFILSNTGNYKFILIRRNKGLKDKYLVCKVPLMNNNLKIEF